MNGLIRRRPRPLALLAAILTLAVISTVAERPARDGAADWQADVDPKFESPCIAEGCHPVELGGGALKHVPFLEGRCLSCHVGHDVEAPNLLQGDLEAKCAVCHDGIEKNHEGGLVHPPQAAGCTECHDPHESLVRNRLRSEERLIGCSECHADFLKEAGELPFNHDFFNPQTDCGSCHYAHQRSQDGYLRENVSETCLTCHDLAIQVEGRKLENIGRELRESKMVHGAMDSLACSACHTPHGSKQSSLLGDDYPTEKYVEYTAEQYALCWKCHDASLTESESGIGATGFRDAGKNLHRIHVAELDRGRACHVCHTAHAADRPHLLREQIRFKNWDSRFEFVETPTGGSCETACHRVEEYRR